MRLIKILNNNTVLVSEQRRLAVITGNGVGYARKKGDEIELLPRFQKFVLEKPDQSYSVSTTNITKTITNTPKTDSSIYKDLIDPQPDVNTSVGDSKTISSANLDNSNAQSTVQHYLQVIQEVPPHIIEVVADIVQYARKHLPRKFSDTAFYSLADHINFAILRKEQGIDFPNVLAAEIKVFYPEEYEVGQYAINLLKERLKIEFDINEKSFVAMHFANAELGDDFPQFMEITKIISDVSQIIRAKLNIMLDKDSLSYFRFVTHIKFFAQRVLRNEQVIEKPDDTLFDLVKDKFPEILTGARAIKEYVEANYAKSVSNQELAYLTVHLKRVIDSADEENERINNE
ncbi:MAG: PRD domain-containing protein [Bifidobacteriaceae bacterium]|nr:PRD domain-containing protein [Bifidobacteriaceae bacterium]